jgi:hypothetical protein
MVLQIVRENRRKTAGESLLEGVGSAVEQLPQVVEAYAKRKRLETENAKLKQLGIDVTGIDDQNMRNLVAQDDLKFRNRKRQVESTNKLYGGDILGGGGKLPEKMPNEQPQTQKNKFENVLNTVLSDESHGFQKKTPGGSRALPTPEQRKAASRILSQESQNTENPISVPEAQQIIDNEINYLNTFNQQVESERALETASQERYGGIADQISQKFFSEYDDPILNNYLQGRAEEYSLEKNSEADIKKSLLKDATNLRNEIERVKKGITAQRIGSKIYNPIKGNSRSNEKAMEDVAVKIKPLLDKGMIELSRQLVSEAGFYPEEREQILGNRLSENANKIMATIPKKPGFLQTIDRYIRMENTPYDELPLEQRMENIQQTPEYIVLKNILTKNPQENLILLRKKFEDNNVNWDQFKDMLNMLQKEGIGIDQPQFNTILEEPPLDNLGKIAYQTGFRGR